MLNTTASQEAVFNARLEELPIICRMVTEAAREQGMKDCNLWKLETSLDEACTNIACHGYNGNPEGKIFLHWECQDGVFIVTIEDTGLPFDQTQPTSPDFTSSLCNRKIGGLGRFIMHQFLDGMNYRRVNNKNTLTLIKKLQDS